MKNCAAGESGSSQLTKRQVILGRGSFLGVGMWLLGLLLDGNFVFAQMPVAVSTLTVQDRLEALEKKTESPSLWKTLGFKVSGFLDLTYTQNFNNPSTNVNQMRVFETNANAFMVNLAQLMLERPADAAGHGMERMGFRTRLNFGADARVTRARTNYQPGTSNDEVDFQEVYVEYIAPIGNDLKIQVGKVYTLIGYEMNNSFENTNISRSFMWGVGQPYTTTGIRLTYTFNPMVTATMGIINGWDNVDDNNKGKTLEWLLAVTPHEKFGMRFYGSYGAEQTNSQGAAAFSTKLDPTAKRTVVGSIVTFKPTDYDTVVVEPYYANEGNASTVKNAKNARWNGIAAYVSHDFSEQWSAHIRGDIFEDAGGARTCLGGVNFAGGTNTCAGSPVGGGGPGGRGCFPDSLEQYGDTSVQTISLFDYSF